MIRRSALIIISLMIFSCGICTNKTIYERPSPNKKNKIVVFVRNGGATTDWSTQVSILLTNNKLLNLPGNIMTSDTNHGKAKVDENGKIQIEVFWIDDNEITIRIDKNARIYKNESMYRNIKINYEYIEEGDLNNEC